MTHLARLIRHAPRGAYDAALQRLFLGFDRRYPREDGHRTAEDIVASIRRSMEDLRGSAPDCATFGALHALAWFHRCAYGRWGRDGSFCPSYHPEDTAAFLRSLQRLPREVRCAVVAEMGDLDPRKVRALARLRPHPALDADAARERRSSAKRAKRSADGIRASHPDIAKLLDEVAALLDREGDGTRTQATSA